MLVIPTPRFPLPSLGRSFWGWRGITWTVVRSPGYDTVQQTAITGRSARTANYPDSITHWTLAWAFLRDNMALTANAPRVFPANEAETLESFFRARRGGFEPWFWMDPTDKRTEGEVLCPSTPAPGDDLANPDSTMYQLVRTFGLVTEPVGGMNEGEDGELPPEIFVDGIPVLFTPNAPLDGWITLNDAPPAGSVLTGSFSYYQRVTFKADSVDFEAFAYNFREAKKVELVTAPW